jgi:hypothetical protein
MMKHFEDYSCHFCENDSDKNISNNKEHLHNNNSHKKEYVCVHIYIT